MTDEKVLVVPAAAIEAYLASTFDPAAARAVTSIANETRGFLPRSQVEQDESVKQIIPYVCIRSGNSYVLLQRTKKQSEARLHNKFSLGIGGHINDEDESLFCFDESAYRAAVRREIEEEIRFEGAYRDAVVALINDDETEVGRVHLGVVHLVDLPTTEVRAGEKAIAQLQFLGLDELRARRDTLETWSQIVLDAWESLQA